MIIARKVHLGLFPVMKRVGGFANELHHLYVEDDGIARAHSQALRGWPPIRQVQQAKTHAALQKITELLADHPGRHGVNHSLIQSATELGLNETSSPARLLEWARSNRIRMHGLWVHQVRRWQHWDEGVE